ncbi:MAG TPA: cupin domain-containing protein [Solirubrobacteraceae bacterium]|nr:cupin domain-containing protein [Solirubrobacteraceae bacterium]
MADAEQVEELSVGPGTTLRVLSHDERALVFEARYAGGGSPPPAHLHPAQDERFEIRAGEMQAIVGGKRRTIRASEVLEIPRETIHQMWNEGAEQATVIWQTLPAGRTLDWFRELAAALRGEGRENPATLLDDYADVFRLADQ